ncbi:MAG TPA: YciI family protein [Polyangiaceae bacterium]|nr:YciI family protein [Polyangiaceae bacterium]
MKFMLMMHAPRGDGEYGVSEWKSEELGAHIQFMRELNQDLREAGELVGAEGLAPPGQARIVRSSTEGAPEVTDGPFAESKEFLVGFWIVDVETAERAYAIAGKASTAPGPGGKPLGIKIEVRQVMGAPGSQCS